MANLLPEEYVYTVEHLSETAVWYAAERNKQMLRFVAIPEAQKIPEGVMESYQKHGLTVEKHLTEKLLT